MNIPLIKKGLLIAVSFVALCGILIGIFTFYSPGVHYFFNAAHFETKKFVHIMDLENDSAFIKESEIAIYANFDGIPANGGIGSFRGIVGVEGYEIPLSEITAMDANSGKGIPGTEKGEYIHITYWGSKREPDENGYPVSSDYTYEIYLTPTQPEQFIIFIHGNNQNLAAVNGSSYEESKKILTECLQTIQQLSS